MAKITQVYFQESKATMDKKVEINSIIVYSIVILWMFTVKQFYDARVYSYGKIWKYEKEKLDEI